MESFIHLGLPATESARYSGHSEAARPTTNRLIMHFHYDVPGDDFSCAGSASAEMKKKLKQLGIPFDIVKRTAVAMYEAEINMVRILL